MIAPQQPVCISGAGIAGMAAALALAGKGVKVQLFEKATQLSEVGAGVQIGPNATAQLNEWGVLDSVYTHAVEPEHLALRDGTSGKSLVEMDLYNTAYKRWGIADEQQRSPYFTIHRADLQSALYEGIKQDPLIDCRFGHEIVSYSGSAEAGFSLEVSHGETTETIQAPLLIGCDGVWSKMRARLGEKSVFSGYVAWRATIDATSLPLSFLNLINRQAVTAWMGPEGHFVTYPLRKGKIFNFVLITEGENIGETWSKKGDTAKLLHYFKGWNTALADIIKAGGWTWWPLFKMPTVRFLGPDNEIFLGDASHAVTPFAAQGAAMALEDAAALAETVVRQDVPLLQALKLFDTERQKRLKAVARRGDFNRCVYHASGPVAFARNLVMKLRPADSFLSDLDWLYGYDSTAFVKEKGLLNG
ncbi:MAG: Salicylate hydroxylase [Candidatus Tokpelaia hoelldobleri]|uniref:Salicylate hydroxylase n=1 Tax=Candidatus Tokpelaia hoelldobleri TaxID=1902579 RepID=A0A1U9JUI7_9HYPH|nr:MAG: Salicylate hydroxylase [Candidatus Tokpelaia hoelldoblerii]